MNLNVTLEFACYTQYGEYMYIFIYGKTLGPTITAFCGKAIFSTKNAVRQSGELCSPAWLH